MGKKSEQLKKKLKQQLKKEKLEKVQKKSKRNKADWLKRYRKSKDPLTELIDICGCMMLSTANQATSKDYYNVIKYCDLEANRIAALNKVFITDAAGDWKLCKNWYRMMLLQVMFRGLDSEKPTSYKNFKPEKDDWLDKAKFLYADLGWDYTKSLVLQGDDQRTVQELFYISTDNIKEYFKVLLEPVGVFTINSRWVSSKGKVWVCDGIENGFVLFSAEEEYNGKHKTLTLAPVIARGMKKVS